MSELVAIGEQILAAEQARIDEGNAAAEAQALPQVLALLGAISARLAQVEGQLVALTQVAMAPRVRRPVRDASGAIQYVVDELQTEET